MKQIQDYPAEKYQHGGYTPIEEGIYQTEKGMYVTSLSFVQEPELGEGSGSEISQYPLEDVLDRFFCHISDFYEELNTGETCYLEFAAPDAEDVRRLRTIIGKHVYNQEDGEYIQLMIE